MFLGDLMEGASSFSIKFALAYSFGQKPDDLRGSATLVFLAKRGVIGSRSGNREASETLPS